MARNYYHHSAMNSNSGAPSKKADQLQEPVLWKCIILAALTYMVWSDKLSIVLDFNSPVPQEKTVLHGGERVRASLFSQPASSTRQQKKSKVSSGLVLPKQTKGHSVFVMDPGFGDRNKIDPSICAAGISQCQDYVARYAPVAIAEMHKFGIPASIILAQGLLESNAGDSNLAQRTNNHFGIKCFSNRCKKDHCINFADESHKDFFVRYDNVWSSYRSHSKLLKNNRRYAPLFKLTSTDYRGWANGLAKAGYATDKNYADKLLALIQNLHLYAFDKQ
ncbi:MAG: glucosaminidase domain-containing protein [Lewinellaceae bacterium]|nr:glucosaminidase domain-containing protein [Saprospiraceae bacterium]MCB9316169.1 glucosaminidase domain-containing protein [Lewinellaceae bacterium]MCB9329591.1 glucosaminidase domain-containing protein [Lewinellaceae bacterium]